MVATLWQTANSAAAAIRHVDEIYSVAQGGGVSGHADEVSSSWKRCVVSHAIDPDATRAPRVLTANELRDFRKPVERLVVDAQEEVDRLYNVVQQAGYVVLLCNADGVAVDHRGNQAQSREHQHWGTWLGGVWSEQIEGTNGIGTCIAEQRPVTIHRNQHFRTRHIGLSCSGAPIFDVNGQLQAVLDVSCIDPTLSERSHALTGALTVAAARAVEERLFRERFRRGWVVAVAPPAELKSAMLLAVDDHQRLIGADRYAVSNLRLHRPEDISLWTIFERHLAPFRRKDGGDIPTQLVLTGTAETWPALITPPEPTRGGWRSSVAAALHTRPRLDLLRRSWPQERPLQVRGGLPPRALRRVSEYVEAHLHRNVDLQTLAATAELSIYHFARAFKQSTGMTPHFYLLQKRIERAREMLIHSDLSLSEIAIDTGFTDHSHFARHFRRLTGMTPSEVRSNQR